MNLIIGSHLLSGFRVGTSHLIKIEATTDRLVSARITPSLFATSHGNTFGITIVIVFGSVILYLSIEFYFLKLYLIYS